MLFRGNQLGYVPRKIFNGLTGPATTQGAIAPMEFRVCLFDQRHPRLSISAGPGKVEGSAPLA